MQHKQMTAADGGLQGSPITVGTGPAVDLTHLRRFTLGNRPLEREVLQLFVDQAPLTLAQLRHATSETAWHHAAHTLKGSAAAIGANAVVRTAEEAELLRFEPGRWPEILERLHTALADACQFIKRETVVAC